MLFLNGYESITSGDTTHDYDVLSDCTYVYTITVSSVVRQESEERESSAAHEHVVDERLIVPRVVQRRREIHVTVEHYEQRSLPAQHKYKQNMCCLEPKPERRVRK